MVPLTFRSFRRSETEVQRISRLTKSSRAPVTIGWRGGDGVESGIARPPEPGSPSMSNDIPLSAFLRLEGLGVDGAQTDQPVRVPGCPHWMLDLIRCAIHSIGWPCGLADSDEFPTHVVATCSARRGAMPWWCVPVRSSMHASRSRWGTRRHQSNSRSPESRRLCSSPLRST